MNENSPIDSSAVFVTGATGFIGNHLISRLLERGCTVHCLVRKTSDLRYLEKTGVRLHTGDLTDASSLKNCLKGIDHVFHCAGLTRAKTKKEYFEANAQACRILYESCEKYGNNIKSIIQLSSLAAVGPSSPQQPVDENTPCSPVTHYGKSKLAGEEIALQYSNSLPIVILRPPLVYGPNEKNFFVFLKTLHKGWNFQMGNGERILSLVYVDDLVRAMMTAAENPVEKGSIFIITDGNTYHWETVVETSARLLQATPRALKIPENLMTLTGMLSEFFSMFSSSAPLLDRQRMIDVRQSTWTGSPKNFFNHFHFKPNYDLSKGLEKTLNWYRQQRWL